MMVHYGRRPMLVQPTIIPVTWVGRRVGLPLSVAPHFHAEQQDTDQVCVYVCVCVCLCVFVCVCVCFLLCV